MKKARLNPKQVKRTESESKKADTVSKKVNMSRAFGTGLENSSLQCIYAQTTARKTPKATVEEEVDDSGCESDGFSALRNVEESQKQQSSRRGPENASMQSFEDPVPTKDKNGQIRWSFKCKRCTWYEIFWLIRRELI